MSRPTPTARTCSLLLIPRSRRRCRERWLSPCAREEAMWPATTGVRKRQLSLASELDPRRRSGGFGHRQRWRLPRRALALPLPRSTGSGHR
jgi:hypothetical protein